MKEPAVTFLKNMRKTTNNYVKIILRLLLFDDSDAPKSQYMHQTWKFHRTLFALIPLNTAIDPHGRYLSFTYLKTS